jgi:hypothetical protein
LKRKWLNTGSSGGNDYRYENCNREKMKFLETVEKNLFQLKVGRKEDKSSSQRGKLGKCRSQRRKECSEEGSREETQRNTRGLG